MNTRNKETLDPQKKSIESIARIFLVQPEQIGSLDTMLRMEIMRVNQLRQLLGLDPIPQPPSPPAE